MDTDADQHPRMNTDQVTVTIMDTGLGRVTTDTAHRLTDVMDIDQGRVTTDTAYRPAATIVMGRDAATVMDTDHGTSTTAHCPALSHRPARTMDSAHRPVTATETAQDLATIIDTDQGRVTMDTVHRPVTEAPLEHQPIRQRLMRPIRNRYRTCPRLLPVNNDSCALHQGSLEKAYAPALRLREARRISAILG